MLLNFILKYLWKCWINSKFLRDKKLLANTRNHPSISTHFTPNNFTFQKQQKFTPLINKPLKTFQTHAWNFIEQQNLNIEFLIRACRFCIRNFYPGKIGILWLNFFWSLNLSSMIESRGLSFDNEIRWRYNNKAKNLCPLWSNIIEVQALGSVMKILSSLRKIHRHIGASMEIAPNTQALRNLWPKPWFFKIFFPTFSDISKTA